jgi:hypothetical protein
MLPAMFNCTPGSSTTTKGAAVNRCGLNSSASDGIESGLGNSGSASDRLRNLSVPL